ncbi:Hypothetical predicted protein [Xyrichtys novacula]|uniref:E2F/DP family winged-helix DNA-binding domain-containing protein n=1 Tax=Xyrichtys novacula TaxID=13765 RepID=A0AAV1HDL1_XYRNO|nr:Hypothetical predicted protein [Xyrichtys novacula]
MIAGSPESNEPWPLNPKLEKKLMPDSAAPRSSLSRDDTSLVFLTRRFAELLKQSTDGVLDLNLVSEKLNAPKRRVYDVTHVLEGVHLIEKVSKNHIQWLGGQTNKELKALIEEENKLDELIQSCMWQIHHLCKNQPGQRFAYLTYEDVRRIPSLEEQTVIVIKAPAETKLEVPHPNESLQVRLSSTQGPIEVFVCSDDPIPTEATGGSVVSGGDLNLSLDDDSSAPIVPCSSFVQVSSEDRAVTTSQISDISSLLPELTQQQSSPVSASPVSTMTNPTLNPDFNKVLSTLRHQVPPL